MQNNTNQPAIVAELDKLRETMNSFAFINSVKFFTENAKRFQKIERRGKNGNKNSETSR